VCANKCGRHFVCALYSCPVSALFLSKSYERYKCLRMHLNKNPSPMCGSIVIASPIVCCCCLSLRRHTHGPFAKRLMHMLHLSGNASRVSKSSSDWLDYTGFPWDVCVAFFNVSPGNKDDVAPKPSWKPSCLQMWWQAYQDQLNTGVSKVCEI